MLREGKGARFRVYANSNFGTLKEAALVTACGNRSVGVCRNFHGPERVRRKLTVNSCFSGFAGFHQRVSTQIQR